MLKYTEIKALELKLGSRYDTIGEKPDWTSPLTPPYPLPKIAPQIKWQQI
jgi:hypothetical protein